MLWDLVFVDLALGLALDLLAPSELHDEFLQRTRGAETHPHINHMVHCMIPGCLDDLHLDMQIR